MGLARLVDDSENSNEVYLLTAALTIKSLSETLKQYRTEVEELRKKILSGKIQFLALEYGDQSMALMTKFSEIFLPMARENLKKRGLKDGAWLDDAFLIFAGPVHYLAQTSPEIMKSVSIIHVEDDALMEKSLEAMKIAENELQDFIDATPENPELHEFLKQTFLKIVFDYDQHTLLDNGWLISEIGKGKIPVSLLEKAMQPLGTGLGAAELMRQRDNRSSKKLLEQKGSGALLIGGIDSDT